MTSQAAAPQPLTPTELQDPIPPPTPTPTQHPASVHPQASAWFGAGDPAPPTAPVFSVSRPCTPPASHSSGEAEVLAESSQRTPEDPPRSCCPSGAPRGLLRLLSSQQMPTDASQMSTSSLTSSPSRLGVLPPTRHSALTVCAPGPHLLLLSSPSRGGHLRLPTAPARPVEQAWFLFLTPHAV
ncbi:predicted GPI-anchored protein 58 isoform X2 [Choloepus didactylus]|uniref:predicted GPI-anchored protein 58 isoform X2 n=1 Tax=Choloepus didactylus TaxID=27675 RepID=UPI0018A07C10|nr:predicted GPI-anchored protein 58 isoform X2 [Choloepus didactylus]